MPYLYPMSLENPPLHLNEDFNYALDALEKQGRSMFITGRAGTGKSTLLRLLRQTTRKKMAILAPTGVAALNVQGQTIHSFFGFPPRIITQSEATRRETNKRLIKLYQSLEVLVIDEISMVRADMIDGINRFLQVNRGNLQPFGGVQTVFFGDLFQLPPVVTRDPVEANFFSEYYHSPYFFSAHAIREAGFDMEMLELKKVYRQESRHFLRLLEAVRSNTVDYDDLDDLNARHLPGFKETDGYITLCARNATADKINQTELQRLEGDDFEYLAKVEGSFDPTLYPVESVLKLRLGAQVMFVKNDLTERQYVNGTIGKITQLEKDTIVVTVTEDNDKKRRIEVPLEAWEIMRYKTDDSGGIGTETIGTFTQYPLKLAWAITIHKSQGKTFDKLIIDLGAGAFEHGQLYVALSRCRTLEGIVLRRPIRPEDVITDERVVSFYETAFR